MFYTYILKSQKSGRYYIGSTKDLQSRINSHNNGKTKSTRNKGPWVLVWSDFFETRQKAVNQELKIKSYKGGNEFKKLLQLSAI